MRQGGAGAGKAQLAEATDPASPSCFTSLKPSPPDRVMWWRGSAAQSLYACGGGGGAPSRMREAVVPNLGEATSASFWLTVFLFAITHFIDLVCHVQSDSVLLPAGGPTRLGQGGPGPHRVLARRFGVQLQSVAKAMEVLERHEMRASRCLPILKCRIRKKLFIHVGRREGGAGRAGVEVAELRYGCG
ncbi:hypothetical protein GWK47_023040 [Chionoecetes opilio]|uniref:Uncharacterized protein n=1 Tax=Chionoecetes opilio TaxID=41210 RepID=A0A8J5CGT3_CHIOP|nr:hypothetical protein GWK47_023040 [Chionoecetes opilio]